MAKRGYKLQEFVAHSGNVNCLRIGKKSCRNFLTGGDDSAVNLWSIGKPEPLTSLSGHTTPVESVAFDSSEVLVVAGASSGVIKLWDLEETKMVRTLTGHKSYCTAVEFHPFGELFASGSMDTHLKIWDIRKKGCIHTYKGHTRGISTIRFTPDGRWVVSGGLDNVVKIWDLTAGKLLHEFKFHEGHVRSIDFHPLEFLLATGSADRTVKFWDLETFEMIGSAKRETAGVRSITFHPDGRTLFCGLDDSLKVYSWEPVICHDSVDIGWSTLGDLCIHDGKILGGAYYQNSVGVWVADISLIEPYGASAIPEQKCELKENALPKSGSHRRRSNSSMRSTSPEIDSKEIKNIYMDTAASNPVTPRKDGSLNAPKSIVSNELNEVKNLPSQKQSPAVGLHAKPNDSGNTKSFIVPNVVRRDGPDVKDVPGSRRESLSSARATSVTSFKPSHVRRPSNTKFDKEVISSAFESGPFGNTTDPKKVPNFNNRLISDNNAKESSEEKHLDIKNDGGKSEKAYSQTTPSDLGKREKSQDTDKGRNPVKLVNGVAVVQGRTRSLVERFERKDSTCEVNKPDIAPQSTNEAAKVSPFVAPQSTNEAAKASPFTSPQRTIEAAQCSPHKAPQSTIEAAKMSPSPAPQTATEAATTSPLLSNDQQIAERKVPETDYSHLTETLMQNHDVLLSTFRSRLTKLQVVRHFWERKDIKGAINAMKKLPDYYVQADVVSVLLERMEIITLDMFSCLLPVLVGLLDSKVERHSSLSLEMLLKLVAVFGPLVRSTVAAPPLVGVDLHAEERLQSCKQCFVHLQNIQKILPTLVRRGGVVARCAQELSLVLQQP